MRYYDIRISDEETNNLIVPFPYRLSPVGGSSQANTSTNGNTSYTSMIGNRHNASALDIEIQIRNIAYGNATGTSKQGHFVRIYGVSLPEIGEQFKLHKKNIVIQAGMTRGLPLAKPEQNGVIVAGKIWQALGNWEGVDKTLEFMIYNAAIQPTNLQLVWEKGQHLKQAIARALSGSSLSNLKQVYAINPGLVNNTGRNINSGSLTSIETFSAEIQRLTKVPEFAAFKSITGGPYEGVVIYKRPGRNSRLATGPSAQGAKVASEDIVISDNTQPTPDSRTPATPLVLKYEDLIGQPTWLNAAVISFKTVMRADIRMGDYVQLPDRFGILLGRQTSGGAVADVSPSRNKLAFQSSYLIRSVSHYGRFRQAAASSWVSIFEGIFTKIPVGAGGTAP